MRFHTSQARSKKNLSSVTIRTSHDGANSYESRVNLIFSRELKATQQKIDSSRPHIDGNTFFRLNCKSTLVMYGCEKGNKLCHQLKVAEVIINLNLIPVFHTLFELRKTLAFIESECVLLGEQIFSLVSHVERPLLLMAVNSIM